MNTEEKDKEEIKVTDKRRVFQADAEGVAAEASEPTTGKEGQSQAGNARPEGEDESGASSEESPPEIDVYDTIRWFISVMTAQAWQHMGLVMNPRTKLLVKDLPQAQSATDCVAVLIQQLEPRADAAEKRELQTLLSNLRLNFVQQSTG